MTLAAERPQGDAEASQTGPPGFRSVRLSANLPEDVFEALKWIAAKHRVTMTEALRRAISTETFIEEQLDKGSAILLQDESGTVNKVIFR